MSKLRDWAYGLWIIGLLTFMTYLLSTDPEYRSPPKPRLLPTVIDTMPPVDLDTTKLWRKV